MNPEDDAVTVGDNAPFFFGRYPTDTARWLAALGDDASAKAGESSYEFRKVLCDLIHQNLRDGVSHVFQAAEQLIAPNNPSVKYLEQAYWKYDEARSAVIETGNTGGSTPGQPDTPGTADPAAGGTPVTAGQDPNSSEAATPGAGTAIGSGTAVTVAGGCGTGRTTGATRTQNTGIGHHGTLFLVHWAELRASLDTRETNRSNSRR